MKYTKPELNQLGSAETLVLGIPPFVDELDSGGNPTEQSVATFEFEE